MAKTFYIHRPLEQPVEAIGGSYQITKEERMCLDDGREVLYLVGHALMDSSCCGVAGCGYADVQGVILRWQGLKTADGLPMTEVRPITDEAARDEIRALIDAREVVNQINFR